MNALHWVPIAVFFGTLALIGACCLFAYWLFKSCEVSRELAQGDFDAHQWFAIEQAMMDAAVTGERVNLSSVVTVDFSKYSRKRFENTAENASLARRNSGPDGGCNASRPLAQNRPLEGLS